MNALTRFINEPSALGLATAGSVDRIFDSLFDTPQNRYRGLSYQLKSEDDAVVAEVEVPGVDPTEVKVRVEGRAILVETPRGNAYFTIGARVNADAVTASTKHGLLTLRVPKREARIVEVSVETEE